MKYLLALTVFISGCATHSWCYKEMENQCKMLPKQLSSQVGAGLSADEVADMEKHLYKSCMQALDGMASELDNKCPKK